METVPSPLFEQPSVEGEATPTPEQPLVAARPAEPSLTPEGAAKQMDGIVAVLGAENISPETQSQITETIAAENIPTPETSSENFEELTGLYRRRISEFISNTSPLIGRLRSIQTEINPRDLVSQPLQEYLEKSLPGLGISIRGMEGLLTDLTPENLKNPQHYAAFLETLQTQKNHLSTYSETCLDAVLTIRKRAQKFLHAQIDTDHELNKAAWALNTIAEQAKNLKTDQITT